jgi:hypothetical protein
MEVDCLTDDEHQNHLRKGLCFKCHELGHWANNLKCMENKKKKVPIWQKKIEEEESKDEVKTHHLAEDFWCGRLVWQLTITSKWNLVFFFQNIKNLHCAPSSSTCPQFQQWIETGSRTSGCTINYHTYIWTDKILDVQTSIKNTLEM